MIFNTSYVVLSLKAHHTQNWKKIDFDTQICKKSNVTNVDQILNLDFIIPHNILSIYKKNYCWPSAAMEVSAVQSSIFFFRISSK